MPIDPKQLILDDSGMMDVPKTIVALINHRHQSASMHGSPQNLIVTAAEFIIDSADHPFTFGLTLEKISTESSSSTEKDLNAFLKIFEISALANSIQHPNPHRIEIAIFKPETILKIFRSIEYEDLIANQAFHLAHQIDLLQTLITQTLSKVITQSQVSIYPPKMIFFDFLGNLQAIIVSSESKNYHLNHSDEIFAFIEKLGRNRVPHYFIHLVKLQSSINMLRFYQHAHLESEHGIPNIFLESKFETMDIKDDEKKIHFTLSRRTDSAAPLTAAERYLFMKILDKKLNCDLSFNWTINQNSDYELILSANFSVFKGHQLRQMVHVFNKYRLIPHEHLEFNSFSMLLGRPKKTVYAPREDILNLLSCPVTLEPLVQPTITPDGNTYSAEALKNILTQNQPKEPLTNSVLIKEQLRENLIIKRIICHFNQKNLYEDPTLSYPKLLINRNTGDFFINPMINEKGITVEDHSESRRYLNRSLMALTAYYQSALHPRKTPIIRKNCQNTVAINIALLHQGNGALTEIEAMNEAELKIPYVEYDVLADSLIVLFSSTEYARKIELGLKMLQTPNEPDLHFENIILSFKPKTKTMIDSTGKSYDRIFYAQLILPGKEQIKYLLEDLCALPSEYFASLIQASHQMGIAELDAIILNKEKESRIERKYQLRHSKPSSSITILHSSSLFNASYQENNSFAFNHHVSSASSSSSNFFRREESQNPTKRQRTSQNENTEQTRSSTPPPP